MNKIIKIYNFIYYILISIFIIFTRKGAYIKFGPIYIAEFFILLSLLIVFILSIINKKIILIKDFHYLIFTIIIVIQAILGFYETKDYYLIYRNAAFLFYLIFFIFIFTNLFNFNIEINNFISYVEKIIDISLIITMFSYAKIINFNQQGEAISQYLFLGLLIKIFKKRNIFISFLYLIVFMLLSVRSAFVGAVFVLIYNIIVYYDIILIKINKRKLLISWLVLMFVILTFLSIYKFNESFKNDIIAIIERDPFVSNYGTFLERLNFWKQVIYEIKQSIIVFLFGVNFKVQFIPWRIEVMIGDHIDPHNSLMNILYRTGIVGIIVFLKFIYKIYKKFNIITKLKINSTDLIIMNFMIFMIGHMNFSNILEGPYKCIIYWYFFSYMICKIKDYY